MTATAANATPSVPPERLLSIIVPARNQGRTLKTLLEKLKGLKPPPGWGAETGPAHIRANYTWARATDLLLDVLMDRQRPVA